MVNYRQVIADLADDVLAGKISRRQFQASLPEYPWEDSDTDKLVDAIMHEPHIGWFLGVDKAQGKKNRAEILQLLERVRA